ncbi:MAG: recombinase family protein, partial [Rickettsiales bacterium]|nr:recombinase family protein [Rickettsiales bacterium]
MAIIGYARVSSVGQSLDVQLEQLKAGGCEKVFSEKITGTTTKGRSQLALALDYVREGDVLVVTRMDRLSRSLTDLRLTVDQLTAK